MRPEKNLKSDTTRQLIKLVNLIFTNPFDDRSSCEKPTLLGQSSITFYNS